MSGAMRQGFAISTEMRARMRAARQRMLERARAKGLGKRLSYRVQTALLFPLIWVLRLMRVDTASRFGGWFGRGVVYRLIDRPSHYETMRVAFPQAREAELETVLLGMSDNIGRVLGETIHLTDFMGTGNPRLVIKGAERVAALRAQGKPVLFLGGHFGNWEVVPVALRAAGFDGISVVQHPNNPHVLEWIATERYRAGLSAQIGAGEGVYAALRRELRAGGCAAMLADQRVLNGIRAPFFGVATTTNPIPARLARELGAAVVLMSNRRLGGAHFEIELHEPLLVAQGPDRAADELAFTTQINRFYAEQIVAAPAYWLWGHPRFDDALHELDAAGKRKPAMRGDETGRATD